MPTACASNCRRSAIGRSRIWARDRLQRSISRTLSRGRRSAADRSFARRHFADAGILRVLPAVTPLLALAQATFEIAALDVVSNERNGAPIRRSGCVDPPEATEEIRARGVQQVVLIKRSRDSETVDHRQP